MGLNARTHRARARIRTHRARTHTRWRGQRLGWVHVRQDPLFGEPASHTFVHDKPGFITPQTQHCSNLRWRREQPASFGVMYRSIAKPAHNQPVVARLYVYQCPLTIAPFRSAISSGRATLRKGRWRCWAESIGACVMVGARTLAGCLNHQQRSRTRLQRPLPC